MDVRDLKAADFSACAALAASVFGIAPEFLSDWVEKRLVGNPWQHHLKGYGVGVWDGDSLAGCRFMFAQPWWINGRETVAAFAAHTCSHPDYRGKGLGDLLVRKSGESASVCGSTSSGRGTQPVYHRNGYAEIGSDNGFYRMRVSWQGAMVKRLGRPVGTLVGAAFDAASLVPRRNSSPRFKRVEHCDERFDRLWERARGGFGAALVRSSSYLNWRIFDEPTCPLRIAALLDASDEVRCFGVWHEQPFDQHVRMAVLRDIFFDRRDRGAGDEFLSALLGVWREEGISWASLEVAHPVVTDLFRKRRASHVPSRGGRYFMRFADGHQPVPTEQWLRSALDGDYCDLACHGVA